MFRLRFMRCVYQCVDACYNLAVQERRQAGHRKQWPPRQPYCMPPLWSLTNPLVHPLFITFISLFLIPICNTREWTRDIYVTSTREETTKKKESTCWKTNWGMMWKRGKTIVSETKRKRINQHMSKWSCPQGDLVLCLHTLILTTETRCPHCRSFNRF